MPGWKTCSSAAKSIDRLSALLLLLAASAVWATGPLPQAEGRVDAATAEVGVAGDVPLPSAVHPEISTTNIDFTSRALFGAVETGAMVQVGNYLYVGMHDALVALNVVDPSRPMMVGWLELDSHCMGVAYPGSGNYIYVSAYQAGFLKVSISNPAAPSVVSTYAPVGVSFYAVTLSGTKAYITAGANGLYVVDTSTMTLSTTHSTPSTAYGVDVLGNYAYVAATNTVQIFDITTIPPTFKGSVATTAATAVKVVTVGANTRVYVADNTSASDLRILDVTTPTAPTQLGTFNAPGSGALDVAAAGTTVYLAGNGYLVVVDASVPATPAQTKSFTVAAGRPCALVMNGAIAYLGAQGGGVQIVDTAPATPTILGAYRNVADNVYDVAVTGGKAYFAVLPLGLMILDMATPQRPSLLGYLSVPSAPIAVAVSGTTAFVAHSAGIRVVNASDPSAPVLIRDISAGWTYGLRVGGNYIFAAANSTTAGLKVWRVSDGVQMASLDIGGAGRAIELLDSVAYMTDGVDLVTVDISNPTLPAILGRAMCVGSGERVTVSGHHAFVSTNVGLEVFDISAPSSPYWVGVTAYTNGANSAVVTNGLAYTAIGTNSSSLSILDVTQPWAPAEVGSLYVAGAGGASLAYTGGYVVETFVQGGALMLHYTPQCMDPREPNDAFGMASAITTGSYYDQFICNPGDQDYFALTVPSGGTLTAVMEPPSTLNYDLYLFDASRALLQSSAAAAGQQETISRAVTSGGTYYLLVNGLNANQYSATVSYRLTPSFTACEAPAQALLIYMGRKDANLDAILDILDPNQPSVVTGYNIYRATVPNPASWPLRAANVHDADAGTANVQYIDAGSHSGGPYYYLVKAANATCGGEGP